MKRIMRSLLGCKKEGLSLALAALGFTLGLFVLFGALRFSGDVLDLLYPEDRDAESRYIVINKKVNLRHTLGFGSAAFSQDEFELMAQQDCIRDAGKIVTTNFAVAGAAYMGSDGGMESELFFEAIDDRFLDIHPKEWHWKEGDAQIPAILARDFLLLYNFGFASAKGLPQLTEETIGLLKAYVVCAGDETQLSFTGKIVGFSDRLSTILVPMSFMTWANAEIGQKAPPPVSRVILEIESGQEEAVHTFLDSQSYQTNQERLPVTGLAKSLRVALVVMCVFGVVLILVSLLSLVLIIQLLISRAAQELQLLHQLGFADPFLTRTYVTVIGPMIVLPFVLAGVGIGAAGFVLKPWLMTAGITISLVPDGHVSGLFAGAFMACITLFYGLIGRTIRGIK